jgi:hypothetical protein
MDAHINDLVSQVPGFQGAKGFTEEDGTTLAIVQFESQEACFAGEPIPGTAKRNARLVRSSTRAMACAAAASNASTTSLWSASPSARISWDPAGSGVELRRVNGS